MRAKTVTLGDFKKKFDSKQNEKIKEEVAYYDFLMKFKDAREKVGLTQEELAARANINRTTLSKIETGVRNATVETLMKLAKAMDLEMEIGFKTIS